MIYKYLNTFEGVKIYARIDEDGLCRVTCTENDPNFLEWLAEGHTPLPADEVK